MKITSERLIEHIKKNRYFATMRNYSYKPGVIISLTDGEQEIGKAVVMAVFLNTINFRKPLLKFSGFRNIGEWEQEAMSYYENDKRQLPKFIVLCRIVELYGIEEEEINIDIDTS